MAADPAGTAERGFFVGSHKERFFLVTFPEDVVCQCWFAPRYAQRLLISNREFDRCLTMVSRCAALLSGLVATPMQKTVDT